MDSALSEDTPVERTVTTEEWLDETVPVEPGGTLWIDLDRGRVEVCSHDEPVVHVQAEARGWAAGMALFSLGRHGSDVEIDGTVDGWFPTLLGPRIEVRAWIPHEYSVEIETRGGRIRVADIGGRVAAQTRGGRVEVSNVSGPVLGATTGGSIRAANVQGDLRARTSGGSIRVEAVKGDVETRTSGGSIRVEDAGGQVDARTSGGSITVSFAYEPWGRIETSGGSIRLEFPAHAGTDLDARTSGGRVEIDRDLNADGQRGHSRFRGRINGGGPPMRLRTSGGSIHVKRR